MPAQQLGPEDFEAFVKDAGPSLEQALIAGFGGDLGREAAAEALVYAWEHWDRVREMENAAGYVYRVGRNRAVRMRATWPLGLGGSRLAFPEIPSPSSELAWVEPKLPKALQGLSEKQRTAVVLVHGCGWTLAEVGKFLDVSSGAAHKHMERGLVKLRRTFGGTSRCLTLRRTFADIGSTSIRCTRTSRWKRS